MTRLTNNSFTLDQQPTIGIDVKVKYIELDGIQVRLHIYDTAGQEVFHSVMPQFYRDADGALLVYDVTQPSTLRRLDYWSKEMDKWVGNNSCVKVIVKKRYGRKLIRLLSPSLVPGWKQSRPAQSAQQRLLCLDRRVAQLCASFADELHRDVRIQQLQLPQCFHQCDQVEQTIPRRGRKWSSADEAAKHGQLPVGREYHSK